MFRQAEHMTAFYPLVEIAYTSVAETRDVELLWIDPARNLDPDEA